MKKWIAGLIGLAVVVVVLLSTLRRHRTYDPNYYDPACDALIGEQETDELLMKALKTEIERPGIHGTQTLAWERKELKRLTERYVELQEPIEVKWCRR
jgi:hypothetical protein